MKASQFRKREVRRPHVPRTRLSPARRPSCLPPCSPLCTLGASPPVLPSPSAEFPLSPSFLTASCKYLSTERRRLPGGEASVSPTCVDCVPGLCSERPSQLRLGVDHVQLALFMLTSCFPLHRKVFEKGGICSS